MSYQSFYLSHYGIPGQRKGYNKGKRNGKETAKDPDSWKNKKPKYGKSLGNFNTKWQAPVEPSNTPLGKRKWIVKNGEKILRNVSKISINGVKDSIIESGKKEKNVPRINETERKRRKNRRDRELEVKENRNRKINYSGNVVGINARNAIAKKKSFPSSGVEEKRRTNFSTKNNKIRSGRSGLSQQLSYISDIREANVKKGLATKKVKPVSDPIKRRNLEYRKTTAKLEQKKRDKREKKIVKRVNARSRKNR